MRNSESSEQKLTMKNPVVRKFEFNSVDNEMMKKLAEKLGIMVNNWIDYLDINKRTEYLQTLLEKALDVHTGEATCSYSTDKQKLKKYIATDPYVLFYHITKDGSWVASSPSALTVLLSSAASLNTTIVSYLAASMLTEIARRMEDITRQIGANSNKKNGLNSDHSLLKTELPYLKDLSFFEINMVMRCFETQKGSSYNPIEHYAKAIKAQCKGNRQGNYGHKSFKDIEQEYNGAILDETYAKVAATH